jgi:hypothetical protein
MSLLTLSPGTLKQSSFDKIGSGLEYDTVYLKGGNFTADTPITFNDGTTVTADPNNKPLITLKSNVDPNIFKKMVPIFGQKKSTAKDILVENLVFFGNDENQLSTPTWNGHTGVSNESRRGQGFHNFLWFKNAANITVRGIRVYKTLGDGLRITNGRGITFYNNEVYECGHDGLYVDGGYNIEAFNNKFNLRTNSAIRFRHTHTAHAYGNYINGMLNGISTGPAFQVEVSATTANLSDVVIENNYVENCYGPGVWAVSRLNTSVDAAKDVTIKNNTFLKCGKTPNLVNCGGIAALGVNNLKIENNLFKDCSGAGVIFADYLTSPAGKGYYSEVTNNTFENTTQSKTLFTGSGAAICNLLPTTHTVKAQGNVFKNNYRDLYNVVELPGDPEEPEPEDPGQAYILLTCDEARANEIIEAAQKDVFKEV